MLLFGPAFSPLSIRFMELFNELSLEDQQRFIAEIEDKILLEKLKRRHGEGGGTNVTVRPEPLTDSMDKPIDRPKTKSA